MSGSRPKRSFARALAWASAALLAVPIGLVAIASPAAADTSQFKGVNWARLGDNFHGGPLILHGLSATDSYTTVRAKADAVYTGFQTNLGANTVRLPVNTYTVGTSWWNSYMGVIDSATAKGFKVVLSYWDDGVAASGGRVVNTAAFNSMWNTVVAKYGANSLVYFEPMNEPGGHSASDWANVAARWISDRPSVPKNRIFVSGAGLNQDIKSMCADSRLNGTYLSWHNYTFFTGAKTYDGWLSYAKDALGNCASRTVLDEFGAPMDTGLNYGDANSTDNFVRYLRGTTAALRELKVGSIYWPGLGGKIRAGQNDDWYAMQKLHGTGTNLTLTTPNASGLARLKHGWGEGDGGDNGGAATVILRNVGTGTCLTAPPATSSVQAQVSTCADTSTQRWTRTASGELTAHSGTKCLDAFGRGTANGTVVGTYACNGGDNQKWTFSADGTVRNAQSGLCVDVAAATAKTQLWSCWGGDNQKWQVTTP